MKQAKKLMQKTVDLFKSQLIGMRDDVNEALIDTIRINYNHQLTPLQNLSLVNQQGRKISITPFDLSLMGAIEDELKKQGFNAYKFSKKTVVVNIPLPSKENSNKVILQVKKLGEDAKISIRNIRKKFRKKQKDDENEKQLQKITDIAIKEIEELMKGA